jgi:tetratricopeptide (TPR) repeat protein
VGIGHVEPAKEALARLTKEYADRPQVEEVWFDLAWRSRDMKGAAEHCERAFTLGSKNAQMLNNCMALEYQMGGESKNLLALLQRVADLQPEDSDIHVRLGLALVNEQKFGLALAQFAQVKTVKPEMAFLFYSASGYAKLRLGNPAESRKDWELAKKYAKDEAQTQSAERFLAELARADGGKKGMAAPAAQSAVPREETAPVFKAESSSAENSSAGNSGPDRPGLRLQREEQQHADGVLTEIDCEGKGWRMHLKTASGELIFFIASANDILIKSTDDTDSFTFQCGTKIGRNATVYYVVQADMTSVAGVARKLVLK